MIPKVVLFDIDNTLYSYTDGNRAAMAALSDYVSGTLHFDADVFQAAWSEAYRAIGRRLSGRAACHNRLIRAQYVLRHLNIPEIPYAEEIAKLYWNTLLETAVPEPGLISLLSALKGAGILTAAGTNMTAMMQFEKIHALGLDPYMDRIYTSEEAGAEKPSAPFFEYVVRDLGVLPSDCVFIGDDAVNDFRASTEYGINGIWYAARPGAHPAEEASVPASHIIRSFEDCVRKDGIYLGDLPVQV